jgi:hypothetical protein
MSPLPVSLVNMYLAHKQHLLAGSRLGAVEDVTRGIVALHATVASAPYLSLWARMLDFRRDLLDDALYAQRTLARLICMRQTLHLVPSAGLSFFFQAYRERYVPETLKMCQELLVQGGLCPPEDAARRLEALQQEVLAVVGGRAATVQEISRDMPVLRVKVIYSAGRPYLGELSIGSRLIPAMCVLGLFVRARPRGTWQSNLYEYAALSAWLPGVDLDSTTPAEARAWLVRQYLSAFGPAAVEDIQWWAGFSKGQTLQALSALAADVIGVALSGSDRQQLMLAEDAQRLHDRAASGTPSVFLLPALDPYIMGYHDRQRFLAIEHNDKVFDRAGNAMPTVWLNGQVAGVWGQEADGSVVWRLFQPAGADHQVLLADEAARLQSFLAGHVLAPRSQNAFYRALRSSVSMEKDNGRSPFSTGETNRR